MSRLMLRGSGSCLVADLLAADVFKTTLTQEILTYLA